MFISRLPFRICLVACSSAFMGSFVSLMNEKRFGSLSIGHSYVCCDSEESLSNLKCTKNMEFSAVYFRHGTRTPLNFVPLINDVVWDKELCDMDKSMNFLPYKILDKNTGKEGQPVSATDEFYAKKRLRGGAGAGLLTKYGQKTSIHLGQLLKERYVEEFRLIDSVYDRKRVMLESTNFSRTIDSMQAVLKGLFGDTINQGNVAEVYTQLNESDYNFPNWTFRESLGRWVKFVRQAPYTTPVCRELKTKLEKLMGKDKEIPSSETLWDTFASLTSNGFTLPKEYKDLESELERCAAHEQKMCVHSDLLEFRRDSFGKIVDDILVIMENVSNKLTTAEPPEQDCSYYKLKLTACHDTTILALLTAMGGFDEGWPALSCYIAFELYRDSEDKKLYVRVIYDGNVVRSSGTDKNGFILLDEFSKKHEEVRVRNNKHQSAELANSLKEAS